MRAMFEGEAPSIIRALIASHDSALRSALMGAISQRNGIKVVGFIRTEEQVLSRAIVSAPEMLVLDAELVRSSPKRLVADLRQALPALKILIYRSEQIDKALARELFGGDSKIALVTSCDANDFSDLHRALNALLGSKAAARSHREATTTALQGNALRSTPAKRKTPEALVIASSTGGPVALMVLLKLLPKSFPLPIAIVQHMPPNFTAMLAERLNSACELDVVEGAQGMDFVPGRVIIGPGDFHMKLTGKRDRCTITLDKGERECSCRPAANVMFRSAADLFGGNLLTVVLTGMGRDGFEGVKQLRSLGSRIIVQDAETSTVWGMPGAIAQAGLADAVLPLPEIANEVMRCL